MKRDCLRQEVTVINRNFVCFHQTLARDTSIRVTKMDVITLGTRGFSRAWREFSECWPKADISSAVGFSRGSLQ